MSNQPFYPRREGDQLTFFTTLQTKIPGYYTALEISPSRQAKLTLVLAWLIWAWQTYLPARRNEGPAATNWRKNLATGTDKAAVNAVPPVPSILTPPAGAPFFGMLTWLFDEIGRWKKAEGFTDPIGEDLAVLGVSPAEHLDPPILTGTATASNTVRLDFVLHEHAGVWIESLVQGDTAMTHLATDTATPYEDTRPLKVPGQAEWRNYRACWWDDATASNDFGPIIRVAVGG